MEVREVTERNARRYTEKWKIQIGHFGNKKEIPNTFARIVSALSESDMGKIAAGKLRDAEKLYNAEEESEITQNELTELGNWEEVANKAEKKK